MFVLKGSTSCLLTGKRATRGPPGAVRLAIGEKNAAALAYTSLCCDPFP
jgi:hypothetical protein